MLSLLIYLYSTHASIGNEKNIFGKNDYVLFISKCYIKTDWSQYTLNFRHFIYFTWIERERDVYA